MGRICMKNYLTGNGKINILEMPYQALENWLKNDLGEPGYRATQIWQWLWQKMARNFADMTSVSGKLRLILSEMAVISWPEIVKTQTSSDGTCKFLLQFADGAQAETVLIPAENRASEIRWTQCLSSQIGCPMGCSFCATGKMGFKRNMSMGEILGQILIGRNYLGDTRLDRPILRNLVFMGMGEPLLNLKALIPALESLANDRGMNFSPRRITVSTCGIDKGLEQLGESGLAYLAISLHAASQTLRESIMPGAAAWPLDQMFAALKKYPLKTREKITFEYLLLGGVNDSLADAKKLAALVSQVKGKVNLINYNRVENLPYEPASQERAAAFQKYLCDRHITAILRKSKGPDIQAACGQLCNRAL